MEEFPIKGKISSLWNDFPQTTWQVFHNGVLFKKLLGQTVKLHISETQGQELTVKENKPWFLSSWHALRRVKWKE